MAASSALVQLGKTRFSAWWFQRSQWIEKARIIIPHGGWFYYELPPFAPRLEEFNGIIVVLYY